MQRILVLGCPGTGKSTVARRLGDRLGLPVHHLDRYYWKPGWVAPERDEWHQILRKLLAVERWILDGNYRSSIPMRLERTDTAIFLDLPRHIAFRRVIKRNLTNQFTTRFDMADGCPEPLCDPAFLRYVWRFNENVRPQVLGWLNDFDHQPDRTVVHLRSDRELEQWLNSLPEHQ